MDTDRKRTSKSKRYELGYHLAIDWCKVPYVLMILVSIYLISTVAASAYQNNTDTRENDIIPSGNSKKIVQKLISVKKDIETDPNLDLSVIALNRNLSSGNVGRLSDFFKLNSSLIKSDEKIMSNFSSDEIGKFSENKTETIKIDLLHNVEIDTTAIPTTENFESSTEFNTEIYTTIVDEEFRSTTEYFSTEDDITTFKSLNENEFSINNISTLDTNDRNISNTKRQLETKNFNDTNILSSTTLKNIVHQIQEQVKSLNDSLHSDENVIEDSYKSTNLTSSDKKSNKTETSSGKFERKMDVLSEVNGTVGSESERNGTALVSVSEIEKIQNITDSKNSSKSSTDDDYNSSYEMEDYDEDKIFTMKKSVTEAPSSGAFDAIRDFAGSVVENIYESFMPKGLKDIFRRMQEQNEKLETIRLRSKEENGGIGQLGRSIIKGITVPINQLMQGVRDYGSLDSDKNFFAGVASGVVSMADSVGDSFKDRVRAIFPGTLWCGDGDMAHSAEVGIFFMTDSCCRRHDACKMYILSGETKFGLTNTGLFTRSHCECDKAFYRCLKRTNSLVSSQIGLTYFSILGPQCFKRDHPIMRCKRRTRITNQKCEEYEMDYTQPKVWQWFDNETF